jgi:DNA polymerase I-like protein with 3'-5' exonuclease and polymerase domains
MDEMKSAFERAMEKAESLGKASEEDLRKWKYLPEGEKLAAKYLREEYDLSAELGKYDDAVRKHVLDGIQDVFVRNIDLPRNDAAKKKNKKIMEAIKELKRDKVSIENVYTKLRRVFSHYEKEGEQQRRQTYEAVKRDFEAKLMQAAQQQGALPPQKINVESHPQFQQEWRRVLAQLDSQYLRLLEDYKKEILSVH